MVGMVRLPNVLPKMTRTPALLPPQLQQAGLALRSWTRKLTSRPFPADMILLELSMGFAVSTMIAAVVRHGIADELGDGSATAAKLATDLGLDADTVHRMLRALADYDIVHVNDAGEFRLTRVGQLLRSDHADGMVPWLKYLDSDATQAAWRNLDASLIEGGSPFVHANGMSIWDWFTTHRQEGDTFGEAMARITGFELPSILSSYPWPRTGVICDIAGGTGTLLGSILRKRPDTAGVLVDYADRFSAAQQRLRELGVDERVQTKPGNIFELIDVVADLYLLKDILHDWDDDSCRQILRTVRAAAPTGSTLLIIEQLQPLNASTFPTSLVDMHMLTQTDGGRQRSAAQLHELMRDAKFAPGPIYQATTYSLVSATARG